MYYSKVLARLGLLFLSLVFVFSPAHAIPRLVLTIPDTVLSSNDTAGIVTIYMDNYADSIAGIEMHVLSSDSTAITFLPIIDTAGTVLAGWEFVGLWFGPARVTLVGLPSYSRPVMPPFPPSQCSVLLRLHYRINRENLLHGTLVELSIDTTVENFGFSDPAPSLIGIEQVIVYDTLCYRCASADPENCEDWQLVTEPPCDSVGYHPRQVHILDTTQVVIVNGSIYIPGCCVGSRGNVNGDAGDRIDLTDLSLLIAHLVSSPVDFDCSFEVDLNASGTVDLTDLSMLIAFLLAGKPLLQCPQ